MYAFCDLLQYAHDINIKIEKKYYTLAKPLLNTNYYHVYET